MEKIGDKIYFDSDDEFTDFCVKPYATVAYLQNGSSPYIKGDYSDEYKRCLKQGNTFVIKDEDSIVYKRQCVSKRVPVKVEDFPSYRRDTLVQLSVQNIEMYFDFPRKKRR